MDGLERWLADVFVELADTLTADFDLIEFLSTLSQCGAELLDGPHVGVMLSDARGRLRHIASSTEDMHLIELLEIQHDEGPCVDCFRSGAALLNQRLDTAMDRWPRFAPEARTAGFRVVSALPMRLRDDVIGAMNIFHVDSDPLEPLDVRLTQALADIATVGILQQRAISDRTELATQLQIALNHRIVIEQAKGMVSALLGTSVDDAFVLLRSYARSHNQQLVDVCELVLSRTLEARELRNAGRGPRPRARRAP